MLQTKKTKSLKVIFLTSGFNKTDWIHELSENSSNTPVKRMTQQQPDYELFSCQFRCRQFKGFDMEPLISQLKKDVNIWYVNNVNKYVQTTDGPSTILKFMNYLVTL